MRRLDRRGFVVGAASLLAGCGGDSANSETPDNPAVGPVTDAGGLDLTSSAFDDGEAIPDRYGRDAENVNPPLCLDGIPADAESLVLIVDDPDAPSGTFLHWLVWNIPPDTREIPEGWAPAEATEGENDFGTTGYGGPAPPSGEHTYRFKLYALDTTLSVSDTADEVAVGDAMRGHVLARTQLAGTYAAG